MPPPAKDLTTGVAPPAGQPLQGFQRRYLRGVAHRLKPVVFVGAKGLTEALICSTVEALAKHELIKAKFLEHKQKVLKTAMAQELAARTDSEVVGLLGHMVIFFRRQPDPRKRRIVLPQRAPSAQKP